MTPAEIAELRRRLCRLEQVMYILLGAVAGTGAIDIIQVMS